MKKLSKKEEFKIVRSILAGNKQAYRVLVKQYERYVYTVAFKITGNPQDAQDVAQDCFVKAYNVLKKFRFQSRFSTWLYRIATNMAISKRRAQKFHEPLADQQPNGQPFTNSQPLKQNDQKKYLQQALNKLEEDDAVILTLFYLKELHLDEIAELLCIRENNAKVRLYRARKKLATQLHAILKDEAETLIQ